MRKVLTLIGVICLVLVVCFTVTCSNNCTKRGGDSSKNQSIDSTSDYVDTGNNTVLEDLEDMDGENTGSGIDTDEPENPGSGNTDSGTDTDEPENPGSGTNPFVPNDNEHPISGL